jgi:hypothetical protein
MTGDFGDRIMSSKNSPATSAQRAHRPAAHGWWATGVAVACAILAAAVVMAVHSASAIDDRSATAPAASDHASGADAGAR